LIFDPLGQLFYASFSGSAAAAPELPTNNIGAQKWRAALGTFDGASLADTVLPTKAPRGMAFAPGGKLLFVANFGSGAGNGNGSNLTILDHTKVKLAIDSDPADPDYNLTGTNPETFENLNILLDHPQFDKLLRTTGQVFDGPQNVCFQEFPVLQLSNSIYHLAAGALTPGRFG